MDMYAGVNGTAKRVDRIHVGIEGTATKVIKVFAGDSNGTARLVYEWVYSILPSVFQQVEYLYNLSSGYIDTGILGNQSLDVRAYVYWAETADACLVGSYSSSSAASVPISQVSNKWQYAYRGITKLSTASISVDKRYKVRTVLKSSGDKQKIWVDGTAVVSGSSTGGPNCGKSLFVFARNNGNTADNFAVGARVYYLQIYTGSTLARDLYPCYRKSDGVSGFYDMANNAFYPDLSGSGLGHGPNYVGNLEFTV